MCRLGAAGRESQLSGSHATSRGDLRVVDEFYRGEARRCLGLEVAEIGFPGRTGAHDLPGGRIPVRIERGVQEHFAQIDVLPIDGAEELAKIQGLGARPQVLGPHSLTRCLGGK